MINDPARGFSISWIFFSLVVFFPPVFLTISNREDKRAVQLHCFVKLAEQNLFFLLVFFLKTTSPCAYEFRMRKEKSCGFAPVLPFVRWQSFISSRIFILYFFLCGRLLFSFFVLSRKLGELSFSFATRRRRWHTHIHTKSLEGFISFPCVARHGRTITQSVASDGTRQKPVGLNATYSLFFVVCTKGFAALFIRLLLLLLCCWTDSNRNLRFPFGFPFTHLSKTFLGFAFLSFFSFLSFDPRRGKERRKSSIYYAR